MMLHVESSPITAAQIADNCPAKLTELGDRIAAHLEKAARCDQKANDHRISAGRLLAEAKKLCDDDGFAAFHERFCPNLGKTRTYELMAIASGKKSVEQIRDDNAERNRRLRERKKGDRRPSRDGIRRQVGASVTTTDDCGADRQGRSSKSAAGSAERR